MNTIWYYIGAVFASSLVTWLILTFYNKMYNYFLDRKLNRNIPTDPGLKGLAIPPTEKYTQKEVEENERRKSDEFREFEHLRHIAERERRTEEGTGSYAGISRKPKRFNLENEYTPRIESYENEPESDVRDDKGVVKFD